MDSGEIGYFLLDGCLEVKRHELVSNPAPGTHVRQLNGNQKSCILGVNDVENNSTNRLQRDKLNKIIIQKGGSGKGTECKMDALGIEPRTFRMRSECYTPKPSAPYTNL
jgi:hypothetical protein